MSDHYEMPHPDADACQHAGLGKACRPCREVLDNLHRINLYHVKEVKELMAEGWKLGEACGWGRAMRYMSDEPDVKRAAIPFLEYKVKT